MLNVLKIFFDSFGVHVHPVNYIWKGFRGSPKVLNFDGSRMRPSHWKVSLSEIRFQDPALRQTRAEVFFVIGSWESASNLLTRYSGKRFLARRFLNLDQLTEWQWIERRPDQKLKIWDLSFLSEGCFVLNCRKLLSFGLVPPVKHFLRYLILEIA